MFVAVKQASPLPQAAHIRVIWVQGVAQTNQEAKEQQGGGALQSRHGPEGKRDRHLQTQTFQQGQHRQPKHICTVIRRKNVDIKATFVQINLVLQQDKCFV